jgi:hypothetical protein
MRAPRLRQQSRHRRDGRSRAGAARAFRHPALCTRGSSSSVGSKSPGFAQTRFSFYAETGSLELILANRRSMFSRVQKKNLLLCAASNKRCFGFKLHTSLIASEPPTWSQDSRSIAQPPSAASR